MSRPSTTPSSPSPNRQIFAAAAAAEAVVVAIGSIAVRIEERVFRIGLGGSGTQTARWLATAAVSRYIESIKGSGNLRSREGACVPQCKNIGSMTIEWDRTFLGPDITIAQIAAILSGIGEEAKEMGVRVHLVGIANPGVTVGATTAAGATAAAAAVTASTTATTEASEEHSEGGASSSSSSSSTAPSSTSTSTFSPSTFHPIPSTQYRKPPHYTVPISPLWHSLAFNYSNDGKTHAQHLLVSFQQEQEEKKKLAAIAKEKEQEAQMAKLSRLLQSDVDDPETLERNFIFDWANVRASLLTHDADVARRLRRSMWQWYSGICDLFRHFSGGSSKGSIASMQKQELVHMLVVCQGIDILKERKLFDKLFERANAGRTGDKMLADDADPDSLSRYELLEFLASFADAKYGMEVDMKTGQPLGVALAFGKYMTDKLSQLISKLNAGPVRAALREPQIQKFLLPRLPVLMQVYTCYAMLDDDGPKPKRPMSAAEAAKAAKGAGGGAPGGGGGGAAAANNNPLLPAKPPNLMNLEEFILLLEHGGLLDDITVMQTAAAKEAALAQLKTGKASLTAQEVRETFSGVQRENDESGAEEDVAAEELTFGEFLEAIGRVAIAKWGDVVGLKYVTDPRQLKAQNTATLSQDIFAKAERTLVRALLMWAYLSVEDLAKHLGRPAPAPVQYDTNELVRLVAIGLPDQTVATSSRGTAKTAEMIEADRLAAGSGGGAKGRSGGGGGGSSRGGGGSGGGGNGADGGEGKSAGPGVELFSVSHPLKPKNPFGVFKVVVSPVKKYTMG